MRDIAQAIAPKIGGSANQNTPLKAQNPSEINTLSFQEHLNATKGGDNNSQSQFSNLSSSSLTALSSLNSSFAVGGHEGFTVLQAASHSAASQFSTSSLNEVI